jgi:hypothetical protein
MSSAEQPLREFSYAQDRSIHWWEELRRKRQRAFE